MRIVALLLVLPLTLCALQLQAAAQSDELAQGHYMAGQAYYKQARYQEAVREFEEAYRLSNKAALLFNIAQAYERMGLLDKTVEYLKRYLAHPGAKERGSVRERLRNLEARLKQTAIKLESDLSGATVLVDGKVVGQTPLAEPIPIGPGNHEIRVTKEGYEDFSAFASVVAGSLVQIKARLKPQAAQSSATPDKPADPVIAPTPQPAPVPEQQGGRFWTWLVGGTSAALLIAGAVTGGLALKKANEANDAGNDEDLEQSAKRLALVSDITLGLGVGAAVAAVVLYFFEDGEQPRRAAVLPLAGPDLAGLGMQLTF